MKMTIISSKRFEIPMLSYTPMLFIYYWKRRSNIEQIIVILLLLELAKEHQDYKRISWENSKRRPSEEVGKSSANR